MKQIETEALALPEPLRASLVWRLLQTLPLSDLEISDEEVRKRDEELENQTIQAISHEEFVRRVEAAR